MATDGLMSPELVRLMQRFVANASITPSTVQQGKGHTVEGVMRAAIEFLSDIDIREFVDPALFPEILDDYTDRLKKALPDGARYWGRARKCLNIFLREAAYNHLLRTTFKIDVVDALLETPLDKYVADGLRRDARGQRLPQWTTIIALSPEQNTIYQEVGAEIAKARYGTFRANLDLWYFRPVNT